MTVLGRGVARRTVILLSSDQLQLKWWVRLSCTRMHTIHACVPNAYFMAYYATSICGRVYCSLAFHIIIIVCMKVYEKKSILTTVTDLLNQF